MNFIKKNVPGMLLCLLIAIPAWYLGKLFPVVGLGHSDWPSGRNGSPPSGAAKRHWIHFKKGAAIRYRTAGI